MIIKNQNVRVLPAASECGAAKDVQLLERDGIVHAIALRCACGELTVVQLEYPSTAPAREGD